MDTIAVAKALVADLFMHHGLGGNPEYRAEEYRRRLVSSFATILDERLADLEADFRTAVEMLIDAGEFADGVDVTEAMRIVHGRTGNGSSTNRQEATDQGTQRYASGPGGDPGSEGEARQ